MAELLKVGVIGVGGIVKVHMPGWHASEHAEVVAGSDVAGDVLDTWGRIHGVEKLYTNPADLITDPDIDIIDICTPNMYHTDMAVAALGAGKHVICEKPLAPTQGHPAHDRARDRSGKLLMTAQHFASRAARRR